MPNVKDRLRMALVLFVMVAGNTGNPFSSVSGSDGDWTFVSVKANGGWKARF